MTAILPEICELLLFLGSPFLLMGGGVYLRKRVKYIGTGMVVFGVALLLAMAAIYFMMLFW